ncbi:glycosyltransferase [Thermococcus indicus]|uniref:Glycosyltransferase n=1 Tax=Thermococcus indicus TaxID=2586643 RepID=A0A4Y5SKI9_9EURY|nr:glycosyltransferase [Thermococcus indicus]QDA30480.1 glycosyltransferase [Thermococcus indicus]
MRSTRTRSYILVTPAKNEEKSLPLLARSVMNQTVRPKLWVIVNDNSTDGTGKLIKELSSNHGWIVGYELRDQFFEYDSTFRYSVVVRKGFEVARKLAHEKGIPYGFIALVDADFILERRFFEKVLRQFTKNPRLGIASGGVYILREKKLTWERTNPNFARGSPRVFRRECFNDIGGYREFYAPDVLSNYMARVKGWDVRQIVNAIAVQTRPTQERYGYYKAAIRRGYVNYCLGTPVRTVLLWALYMGITGSPIKASGFLRGYLEKMLTKEHCIDNVRVRAFVKRDMSIWNNIVKIILTETVK